MKRKLQNYRPCRSRRAGGVTAVLPANDSSCLALSLSPDFGLACTYMMTPRKRTNEAAELNSPNRTTDTMAMIGAACAQLGERALVCAAATDFGDIKHLDHVKIVETMNFAAVFPGCRAVVHHGGAGTTAASLRAGVPTLILWTGVDQKVWGDRMNRLGVGTARRFSVTTERSLIADLRTATAPQCLVRARELARRMTTSAQSITRAADVLENFARLKRAG